MSNHGIIKIARWIAVSFLWLLLLGTAVWGALALYYSDWESPVLRSAAACIFSLFALSAFVNIAMGHRRWSALTGYVVGFALLTGWWMAIKPSNDRIWQQDVAVLPYATFDGGFVTVHNIRNFDYSSETDFTPAYYEKTFDMQKLNSVDFIASYWMGPQIAHTFLSFGFDGGDHLAISIETRREQGEDYSPVKGFFKQYELFYVVADERDLIRLRTNYRKNPSEDVYLFRVYGPLENGRSLFLEYMREINRLKVQPEFYNTLTTNCTTVIWQNAGINPNRYPFSWKILLSGHVPAYLYEGGMLYSGMQFPKLYARSRINARAMAADQDPDFSRRIRVGIPGFNAEGK